MEYQSLNYLGLNEKEKEVYILLLKLGTSRASNLLQKININRSVLYSILNSLENKGFITKIIKQNLTYFNPIKRIFLNLSTKSTNTAPEISAVPA